jgi:hypothetical protein
MVQIKVHLCLQPQLIPGVTSGLNFTQNQRFEFAVAAAAGAVD